MTAFLPQHETLFSGVFRKLRVMWDRRLYQYDYTHISPLAVAKHLPIEDQWGFEWLKLVGRRACEALDNRAQLEMQSQTAQHSATKHAILRELLDVGEA